MRVLIVAPDFYPNSTGFANATINLVNSIMKYGRKKYELFVWTSASLNNIEEFKNCNVIRYEDKHTKNRYIKIINERKKAKYISMIIEKNSIDVVFFETNTFPFWQCIVAKKYKDKMFVRIHSTADTEVPIYGRHRSVYAKYEAYLMKKYIHLVPNILSTSEFYLEFIREKYLNGNVYKIWDDKSYGLLYNTAGNIEVESKRKVINNNFLTMGKMSPNGLTQKGISDAIKAVYYLKNKNYLPQDFKLIVIGDGTMREKLVNYTNRLGIEENIQFLKSASHDEVFRLIHQSRGIVLLSRYEGQSMFITESLALGKPLIITSNNGMQEMVKDGINGYHVSTGNAEEAAKNIKKMLDLSDDEIIAMGNKSKDIYDKSYSDIAIYEQFDKAISLKY